MEILHLRSNPYRCERAVYCQLLSDIPKTCFLVTRFTLYTFSVYNTSFVYCRELTPGTVSLTGTETIQVL